MTAGQKCPIVSHFRQLEAGRRPGGPVGLLCRPPAASRVGDVAVRRRGNTGRCILHIADHVVAPAVFVEEEANVLSAGISHYSSLLSTPEASWRLTAADACRFHTRCLCLTLRVRVKRARFNPGAWGSAFPALRSINRQVCAFFVFVFSYCCQSAGDCTGLSLSKA